MQKQSWNFQGIKGLTFNIGAPVHWSQIPLLVEKYQHDIILIQEHGMCPKSVRKVQLSGYTKRYTAACNIYINKTTGEKCRKTDKDAIAHKKHGVLVFISNHLTFSDATPLQHPQTIESKSVNIHTPEGLYVFHCVYQSHRARKGQLNINQVENREGKHAVIGDLNAKIPRLHRPLATDPEPLSQPVPDTPDERVSIENRFGKDLQSQLIHGNLEVINEPGVPTTSGNTVLDLIIVDNSIAHRCTTEVLHNRGDYHYAVNFTIDVPKGQTKSTFVPSFKLKEANWELFAQTMDAELDKHQEPVSDLGTGLNIITSTFRKAMETSIPKTKYSHKAYKCWYRNKECDEIDNRIRKLTNAIGKTRSSNTTRRTRAHLRPLLKEAQKQQTEIHERARVTAWHDIVENLIAEKNNKGLRQAVERVFNDGEYRKPTGITDPQAKARELAEQFAARCSDKNIPTPLLADLNRDMWDNWLEVWEAEILTHHDAPVTMTELNNAAVKNTSSSPGRDAIPYAATSRMTTRMKEKFLELCNLSYEQRRLPDDWKLADMLGIPKPRERGAFRPITLLSCLDKLMERIMERRARFVMHKMAPFTMGYEEGKGTTDALVSLVAITSSVSKVSGKQPAFNPKLDGPLLEQLPPNTGKQRKESAKATARKTRAKVLTSKRTARREKAPEPRGRKPKKRKIKRLVPTFQSHGKICLYIKYDFTKAFELARPDIICVNAARKGISGKTLSWIKDYVTGRAGMVKFMGKHSDIVQFQNGTPQGSLLSPMLFNLGPEEVLNRGDYSEKHYGQSYADDVAQIVAKAYPLKGTKKNPAADIQTQRNVSEFHKGSLNQGLVLNGPKTVLDYTGTLRRNETLPEIYIDGETKPLSYATTAKDKRYLGVIFDHRLTFVEHANIVKGACTRHIILLKQLACGTSTQLMLRYYTSCVRPKIEFGLPCMLTMSQNAQDTLEKIQNHCLRTILGVRRETPTIIVQIESGCLPIRERRDLLTLRYFGKVRSNFREHEHPLLNALNPLDDSGERTGFPDMYKHLELWQGASYAQLLGRLCRGLTASIDGVQINPHDTNPENSVDPLKYIPNYAPAGPRPTPWDEGPQIADFTLHKLGKSKKSLTKQEADLIAAQRNAEIFERFGFDSMSVFTDGSVSDEGITSFGIYITDGNSVEERHKGKLNIQTGTVTVELKAIEIALKLLAPGNELEHLARPYIHVYTDSEGALGQLQQDIPFENRAIHNRVRNHLKELSHKNSPSRVNLHWVPSHIGIFGNDEADRLAAEAGNLPEATDEVTQTFSHFRTLCERYITHSFQETARKSPDPRIIRYLEINPSCKRPNWGQGNRKGQVVITNLRVSSLEECTHRCQDKPVCGRCKEPFSTSHYLLNCLAAPEVRQLSQECLSNDEMDTLSIEEQSVIVLMHAAEYPERFQQTLAKYPIQASCKAKHPVISPQRSFRHF